MISCLPSEQDVLELGSRAASWLAAAADDPEFMLARHRLLSRPPRRRERVPARTASDPAFPAG